MTLLGCRQVLGVPTMVTVLGFHTIGPRKMVPSPNFSAIGPSTMVTVLVVAHRSSVGGLRISAFGYSQMVTVLSFRPSDLGNRDNPQVSPVGPLNMVTFLDLQPWHGR